MAYMPLNKAPQLLDDSTMPKIYDLSMPWGVDPPLWPFPGARQDLVFPRGQYLGRFHKRTMTYTGTLHAGTHMDAPNHVMHEEEVDRARNGYNLAEIPLCRCIGSGIIVDMRYLKDQFEEKWNAAEGDPSRMSEDIWHIIMPEEFEAACARDGLEVRPNDWVVINTGFHHYWRVNNDKYYNYYVGEGPELARYLVSKGIKGVTGTWGATDAPLWHHPLKEQMPWLDTAYTQATGGKSAAEKYPDYEPCHRIYMQSGVCTVENAGGDIDEVTGRRMTIAAFPFRCEMADGGFVRLVAWEEGTKW